MLIALFIIAGLVVYVAIGGVAAAFWHKLDFENYELAALFWPLCSLVLAIAGLSWLAEFMHDLVYGLLEKR